MLLEKVKVHLQIKWIEKRAEKVCFSGTNGPIGKPEKKPPRAVLEEMIEKVERGENTMLERIQSDLEAEDAAYCGFCARVREHARRYDDEAIIRFIKEIGKNSEK